jgi:hypothetical protein
VIDAQPIRPPQRDEHPAVDVVLVHQGSRHAVERTLSALAGQSYSGFTVIVAAAGAEAFAVDGLPQGPVGVRSEHASIEAAREAGLREGSAPWVVFLDEGDEPESGFLETLVAAQAASGADVVSCALRIEAGDGSPTQHFFAGEPKGTGVLANGYGTVALLRRSLLGDDAGRGPTARDPDWPLLAGLSASGARIVSVPVSLVTRRARPGTIERDPTDALLVLARLEQALPDSLRSLARLVAGLAADAQRASVEIRRDGVGELLRRARRRALRLFSA